MQQKQLTIASQCSPIPVVLWQCPHIYDLALPVQPCPHIVIPSKGHEDIVEGRSAIRIHCSHDGTGSTVAL